MKLKQLLSVITGVVALASGVTSSGQNLITWTGADGNFFDPANWDSGAFPGDVDVTDIAVIDNGTTATIAADSGEHTLGAIRLGSVQGGSESGHIIMNGGILNIATLPNGTKVNIGNSAELSTFIMNGGTIFFDGPDAFPGSTGDDG